MAKAAKKKFSARALKSWATRRRNKRLKGLAVLDAEVAKGRASLPKVSIGQKEIPSLSDPLLMFAEVAEGETASAAKQTYMPSPLNPAFGKTFLEHASDIIRLADALLAAGFTR